MWQLGDKVDKKRLIGESELKDMEAPVRDVNGIEMASAAIEKVRRGAFLTCEVNSFINTMTIGWVQVGFVWSRPMAMVAVRDSRHTFLLMEKAKDFTISIPYEDLHEAVNYCGSHSGAEVNKFEETGLELQDGFKTESPTIWCRGLHYECRIAYKAAMESKHLARRLKAIYPSKDFHTLYFGEIVACYETGVEEG
ncbi:MAG: flavin reductase family protein [Candidatus Sumerlaeota bacterium]